MFLNALFIIPYWICVSVKFITLVEKQKETISGESSDRSQKKKLGKKCSVICESTSWTLFCAFNVLYLLPK